MKINVPIIVPESIMMLVKCHDLLSSKNEFALKDVFRSIHTIKGNFSYFDNSEITELCHELETFLEPFSEQRFCDDELRQVLHEKITEIEFLLSRTTNKVGAYVQHYSTIVSELSYKLGKNIKFNVVGELPDGPWEEVLLQLVHVISNSVDHGIEAPDKRIKMGKNSQGEISLSFRQLEDALEVTLEDDGSGIDWKKLSIKDKTITSLEGAVESIKAGGLSIKDKVSETSGRGVGLSSLFQTIELVGGSAELRSVEGQGVSIKIKLPLRQNSKQVA